MSAVDWKSVCTALPLATSQALAALQLRADPLYERMTGAQRSAFVEAALADGWLLAEQQRALGAENPWQLAARLGVPVRESDGDASFGSVVVCAEYQTRARAIVLYTHVLRRLQDAVDRARDILPFPRGGRAGRIDVRAAFLAHELYHHLDIARGAGSISRRHRVCLLRLGAWRWTSGVTSLAEIGAGAFAQRLLNLPFHAKLFDLFVLLGTDAAAARRFGEALTAGIGAAEPAGVSA